jgi:Mrp family chromosome partitioning ATPase/uncharacterized protein involved in exopolysaccharide biosynthesis
MLTSHDTPAPPLSLPAPSVNGDSKPSLPPQPAPLPPALARPVTISGLARALRRQWVLALSAGVAVGVVAGCLAYALLPAPGFSARASIAVAPRVPADSGRVLARAKSRPVLDAALARPEVQGLSLLADRPDAGEFLRGELTVDWDTGPDVLSVRLSGSRPKELAVLVNAVAEAVVQDINAAETKSRQSEVARLEQIRRDYGESLDARRKRLEELAGGDPGQRTARLMLAATALGARRAELLRVQGERRTAEALLRAPVRPVADAPKPAEAAVPFGDVAKDDPDLKPLAAELADLNGQVAQFNALYSDNPAKARQMIEERGLQARIDTLRALGREQHEKKLKTPAGNGTPGGPRPAANGRDELKARIASCEAAEESLAKEIRKLEGDVGRLEVGSAEADAVRREITAGDEVSKDLATALEKARRELTAPARAARIDEAAVSAAGGVRRVPLAALTGAGFFALALVGVGFLELRQHHLYTISDVAHGLGLPVAGTQPPLPAALNPLDPDHAESERAPWHGRPNDGADGVRALVVQAAPPTQPRLVMVLGAVGGEGGSVLAVQLAAGLARAGRRTLLVDANLRRPALHRAFGLSAGPGLSEVLRGETAPPAAVRPAPPDRLWVLTAGAADVRARHALARDGGQAVLDWLKRDYDYVVIDGAPALACADALPLAARCDAVFLSVLAGASAAPAVHAAWQRLSLLGARLLGVVVQGAPDDDSARVR